MAAVKKRIVVNKNSTIRNRIIMFTCIKGAAVYIVCNETVSVLKEYNSKTHYETKHTSQPSGIIQPVTKAQNYLSVYVFLSVCLSVCLSIYLFIYLSIYLSISTRHSLS